MKQTLITKISNYILLLLGFATTTSCEFIKQSECEYGTPTMDFEVSGKVVNQDSEPIEGIQVSCYNQSEPNIATTLTTTDGSFSISGKAISPALTFNDIDGQDNGGLYTDKTEIIEVNKVGKGDGHWYMGKYEAKDVVIEMEKK